MSANLNVSLKRIRILKTGLANVQEQIDMRSSENRRYFETLAEPGTELVLRRNARVEDDPFCVEVYSQEGRYLGKVTKGKNETVARMLDAGLKLIALVNESLPVHGSDHNYGHVESHDNEGWTERSREQLNYADCKLPYCIYWVAEGM